jgi:hypothetical protein
MVPITHIKWKSLIHWKETQGRQWQSQGKPSQAKQSKQVEPTTQVTTLVVGFA